MLAAPADARVPRGFVGITANDVFAGNDNHRTANLSAMAAIGIQTIHQTFDWSTIERSPGVYDFSYHDAYVAKASAHGLRVCPCSSTHRLLPPDARARRLPATGHGDLRSLRAGRRAPLRAPGDALEAASRGAEEPDHRLPDLERAEPPDLLV